MPGREHGHRGLIVAVLEREAEVEALRAAVADASEGRGSVVLVTGEAGIGKSTLLRTWSGAPGGDARVLVGFCDDFLTSRAFGPLHDVARATGGALADAVAAGDLGAVLEAVLEQLAYPLEPTVLLLEDLHWADDATLDVVRYVGRRIRGLPAVLVLSYRHDEVTGDHPLTGVLGTLPSGAVHRVALRELSRRAVARLVADSGSDLDPEEVLRVSGGNPFFVTELLAGGGAVPSSVGDAVLARLHRLPREAQECVEALAVVPGAITDDLVEGLVPAPVHLVQAERGGLLVATGEGVRFRHELARRAILGSLPTTVRVAHHGVVLDHLLAMGADPALLLHHAVGAHRPDVVAAHGPRAATAAYRAGANREAVAHHARVLAHRVLLTPATLAAVLEEHAWATYNLGRFAEAAAVAGEALDAGELLDDPAALLRALLTCSRMRYMLCDHREALALLHRAERLASRTSDPEAHVELGAHRLALLHLTDAHERVLAEWEALSIAAAECGRTDAQVYAEVYGSGSQLILGDEAGFARIREAIRRGRGQGVLEPVARAYTNLVEFLVLWRRWEEAGAAIDEAVAFYEDHDFRAHRYNTVGQRARLLVALGRWDEAADLLRHETQGGGGVLEAIPLEARAQLAVRRGDPDAEAVLRRAWDVAKRSGSAQYLVPVACAGIEHAWLTAGQEAAGPYVQTATEAVGTTLWLAHLRWRLPLLGAPADPTGVPPGPERDSLEGDHDAAAVGWERQGMPFEQAVELLRSGAEESVLRALLIFESLGAEPAARMARRRLRALGRRSIPRGPTAATRANPFGLTPRQVEVLDLLAAGLTNAEIAERLVVSTRTVDHHVSTVLQKLGVSSRKDAAAAAAAARR